MKNKTSKPLIVVKETREGEQRVALTPSTTKQLADQNYTILVEQGAGEAAGFTDQEYAQAGAKIFDLNSQKFPENSLILRVKRPSKARELEENKLIASGTTMMGFLDPFDVDENKHIENWKALGVETISLELLDLSADDPKNAQAAMSRFAGRLAFEDALKHYHSNLPKKVTIIGTGPAALSAAMAAKAQTLPVQIFGRRETHRAKIEAHGLTYYVLPEHDQIAFLRNYLAEQTIVITAARRAGQPSPLLIDEENLTVLPENAVIIDLSAGEGGNVVGSKEDQIITTERGIIIANVSGYPKQEPKAASEAYAQCMVHLIEA